MKFPNHILLDIKKHITTTSAKYWIYAFLFNINANFHFINFTTLSYKFLLNKNFLFTNQFLNQQKFTLKHSLINQFSILTNIEKVYLLKIFKHKFKINNKARYIKNSLNDLRQYSNDELKFDTNYFIRIFKQIPKNLKIKTFKNSSLWTIFDINFIRKEKIYTKLKYSRTPQYDIVSGGVAAIFSGFLGFLICEKFGFELIDSADFYFLFMYVVFICFFIRMLFKLISSETNLWTPISLKWIYNFYKILIILFFKFFKLLFHIRS